jgi:hypothetical protein
VLLAEVDAEEEEGSSLNLPFGLTTYAVWPYTTPGREWYDS